MRQERCVWCSGVVTGGSVAERRGDRLRLYNLAAVGEERHWLRDVLLLSASDSSSDEGERGARDERRLRDMLRERRRHNKYAGHFYRDPAVSTRLQPLPGARRTRAGFECAIMCFGRVLSILNFLRSLRASLGPLGSDVFSPLGF